MAGKYFNKYSNKSKRRVWYFSSSTHSLQADDGINFTGFDSVFEYGLKAVRKPITEDDSFLLEMLVNTNHDHNSFWMEIYLYADYKICPGIKNFKSSKQNCAICGGREHSFATRAKLLNFKLKDHVDVPDHAAPLFE